MKVRLIVRSEQRKRAGASVPITHYTKRSVGEYSATFVMSLQLFIAS